MRPIPNPWPGSTAVDIPYPGLIREGITVPPGHTGNYGGFGEPLFLYLTFTFMAFWLLKKANEEEKQKPGQPEIVPSGCRVKAWEITMIQKW